MRFSLQLVALIAALVSLGGCDSEGRTRPPQTTVRVINVAPGYESLDFLREERVEAGLPFGGGESLQFDSDTYELSIESSLPSGATTRLKTISRDVNDENEYFVVITEVGGVADMLFFTRPLDGGDAGLTVVHAAEQTGAVDVYIEAAGTDPAAATPIASVAFSGNTIVNSAFAGDFEVILTAAGDASTVLFRSSPATFAADTSAFLVIGDESNRGTIPFSVYYMVASVQRLVDPNQGSPVVRVINGANDMLARDVYLDSDFTAPLIANTAFAAVSPYVPVAYGTRQFAVTPAGNASVTEVTADPAIAPGVRYTLLIGGNPTDNVVAATVIEDHRSLIGVARLRIVNMAHAFTVLDYYIAAPGTDILTIAPIVSLGPDGVNAMVSMVPGNYELTVRDRTNSTNVAGPTALSLPDGSVQLLVGTDAVGGSTVDLQVFDDTGP